jgi:hypothetical protein
MDAIQQVKEKYQWQLQTFQRNLHLPSSWYSTQKTVIIISTSTKYLKTSPFLYFFNFLPESGKEGSSVCFHFQAFLEFFF